MRSPGVVPAVRRLQTGNRRCHLWWQATGHLSGGDWLHAASIWSWFNPRYRGGRSAPPARLQAMVNRSLGKSVDFGAFKNNTSDSPRTGSASRLLLRAKQTTSRHRPLPSARPQRCLAARLKLLSQTRRLIKMQQPLSAFVNAACGLRQCPPLAAREDHLQPGRGAFDIGFCGRLVHDGQHHRLCVRRQRCRLGSPPPISGRLRARARIAFRFSICLDCTHRYRRNR